MDDRGLITEAVENARVIASGKELTVIVSIAKLLDVLDEADGISVGDAQLILAWVFTEVEQKFGRTMEKYVSGDQMILQSRASYNYEAM